MAAAAQAWVVSEALSRLSREHWAVLVACFYQGRTVRQAAEALGVPEGTVKSRTHYALRALRLALERRRVAEHLGDCAECREALREIVGLPGLLARVPAPVVDIEPTVTDPELEAPMSAPPPPDLLAGAVRRLRRRRWTHRVLAASVAALALGVGVLIGTTAVGSTTVPSTSAAGGTREIVLPAVGGSPASGRAGLVARPWGTEVTLNCESQRSSPPPVVSGAPRAVYVLVVRAADGSEQQIARWSPPPGQDVTVGAATDLPVDGVTALQVRSSTGQVVMAS